MWEPRRNVRPLLIGLGAALLAAVLITTLIGLSGGGEERRVNAVLQQSLDRQAALNEAILQQNREVTIAARRLVEADSEARKEVIALQRDIQAERAAMVRQQEAIDGERRQLAQERHREPILAAAVANAGFLLAVAMALLLCWYLIHKASGDTDEAGLRDLLLREIVSHRPLLIPPSTPLPPAVGSGAAPTLPGPSGACLPAPNPE